jgi:F0F1-type ATP synthase membrane subunit c/vacuolar-type H+-ATPase subunit K
MGYQCGVVQGQNRNIHGIEEKYMGIGLSMTIGCLGCSDREGTGITLRAAAFHKGNVTGNLIRHVLLLLKLNSSSGK